MTTEIYRCDVGGRSLSVLDRFCEQLNRPRSEGMRRVFWVLDKYLVNKKTGFRLALVKDEKIHYLDFQ